MANGHKTCAGCDTSLPLDSFGTHARPNRIPGKRYVNSYCHECKRARDRRTGRGYRIMSKYGLTESDIARMLAEQDGCAICHSQTPNGKHWHVDHDHACCPTKAKSCGKCVRGILCSLCNVALGCVKDNPKTLEQMIAYLGRGVYVG